jgi:predicted short-subunit dehydrogenase-like oxidoreductase (DUF2520 family)
MDRFSVIGAGRVGLHLSQALQKIGFQLQYIFKKALNNNYLSHITNDISKLVRDSDFVFICVQESKIKPLAELVSNDAAPRGKIFFHTANSLTSDELLPLRLAGAAVASFSPLQTFIGFQEAEELFSGITFLLEGDEAAVRLARRIATQLQAKALAVRKQDKMYFHMAAIAAANFLIANLKFAERQLQRTAARPGLDILFPLLEQTLRNIEKFGLAPALSGPLKRGEYGLLEKHCQVLSGAEREYYNLLLGYLREKPASEV